MGTEERYLQGPYFQGLSQASHSFQVLCSPISFLSLTRNPISLSAPNTKFLICIKPLVVGYFCLCVQLFWFESFTDVSGETQKAGDLRGLLPTHPLTIYLLTSSSPWVLPSLLWVPADTPSRDEWAAPHQPRLTSIKLLLPLVSMAQQLPSCWTLLRETGRQGAAGAAGEEMMEASTGAAQIIRKSFKG